MARRAIFIAFILLGLVSFRAFQVLANSGELGSQLTMFEGECSAEPALGKAFDVAFDWQTGQHIMASADGVARLEVTADTVTVSPMPPKGKDPIVAIDQLSLPVNGVGPAENTAAVFAVTMHASSNGAQLILLGENADTAETRTPLDIPIAKDAFVAVAAIDATSAFVSVANRPARSVFGFMRGRHKARNGTVYRVSTDGQVDVAISRLRTPTDLAYDSSSGVLYIAEAGARALSVWQIDMDAPNIPPAFVQFRPLDNTPGHIALDNANRVWVALHPKPISWLAGRPGTPTQIGVVDFEAKTIDQVYRNTGSPLGGGMAAYVNPDDGVMAVFGPGEFGLRCTLPAVWEHSKAFPAQRPLPYGEVGRRD